MAYLDYEQHVENALLGVVKLALEDVLKDGLREPNHFYISFLTNYPGVIVPEYLKEEYPEEITIVIQYQFWDLKVTQNNFSIVLSFNENEEKIVVPYKSIVNFSDPSQNFSLDFNPALPDSHGPEGGRAPTENQENKDNVVSLEQFRKK